MDTPLDLYLIGCKYHYKTEVFDRSLPHSVSPFSGNAIPRPDYHTESSAYASRCKIDAENEAEKLNYTSQQTWKAITKSSELTFKQLEDILTKYNINP